MRVNKVRIKNTSIPIDLLDSLIIEESIYQKIHLGSISFTDINIVYDNELSPGDKIEVDITPNPPLSKQSKESPTFVKTLTFIIYEIEGHKK